MPQPEPEGQDPLPWKCERICGRAFRTPEGLAHHQQVAPLHHLLDHFVRQHPHSGQEYLLCEDCDHKFKKVQSLYHHLLYHSRHRMPQGELMPYGYGARPAFEEIVELLAQGRAQEEEYEEQERQHLIQDEGEESQLPEDQPVIQHEREEWLFPDDQNQEGWQPVEYEQDWSHAERQPWPNLPDWRQYPFWSTFPGFSSAVEAAPSPPTPSPATDAPVDAGPDDPSPPVQNPAPSNPTASASETFYAVSRQIYAASGEPSQSSQPVGSPVDNNTPASPTRSPSTPKPKRQNILIPVSPSDRMDRSPEKPLVFGPPSLQEDLAAMAAKVEALESELEVARKHKLDRQCPMYLERDVDFVTKCGHQFCGTCIDSWQSEHPAAWSAPCPICRKAMGKAIKIYNGSS